jgi:porin-like protein
MRARLSYAAAAIVLAAGGAARADVTLNFFGDISYVVDHEADATSNSFQAATLDVFATQTEGKFSFVGEMIVEALGTNAFEVDVDRLEVAYKPTSWLRFRAGRMRSAIGYYGDAYQNGKYFMIPVSWPGIYESDRADGLLPSHSIGLHADAAYGLGENNGKLTLDAEVLNGRGSSLGDVPVFQDGNNAKAVNLRLRYVGDGTLAGLIVGTNLYVDDIPPNVGDGDVDEDDHPGIHELMLGGHAAYVTDNLHAVAEVAWFHHRLHGSTETTDTVATFGELGYKVGDVTPYVRFEYTHFYEPDPYFIASGVPGEDVQQLSAGAKYTASASVAFKVEGSVEFTDSRSRVIAQAAFAF